VQCINYGSRAEANETKCLSDDLKFSEFGQAMLCGPADEEEAETQQRLMRIKVLFCQIVYVFTFIGSLLTETFGAECEEMCEKMGISNERCGCPGFRGRLATEGGSSGCFEEMCKKMSILNESGGCLGSGGTSATEGGSRGCFKQCCHHPFTQRPTGNSGGCVKELTKVFTLQWPALHQLSDAALKHGNCPKTMPRLWKLDRTLPWTLSAAHGCKQGLLPWECEQMSLKP